MAGRVQERGVCSFAQLCSGEANTYCCDIVVDIRGLTQLKHAKNKIADKIEDAIFRLQIGRGRRVAKIYIGKVSIPPRRPQEGQDQRLDPMDYNTWNLDGISQQFRDHRREEEQQNDYARDGMIVLAAVTEDAIPPRCRALVPLVNKEDYAFAIKQALLHHFLITLADRRVANKGFCTGGNNDDRSAAYAIYMTFTLGERVQQVPPPQPPPTPPGQDPISTSPPPQTGSDPQEGAKKGKKGKGSPSKTKDPAGKSPLPQDKSLPQTAGPPANQDESAHKPTQ